MKSTARYRRFLTALSLPLTAVLAAVSVVLQPEMNGPAGPLAAISEAGISATVSTLAFAYSQVPFTIALLGLSQLIGQKAPILSNLVATFGILGGFGHAVIAGTLLVTLSMAADTANRDVYSRLLSQDYGWVDGPISLLGLLGTVLAILFLGVGLLRTKIGPRWVPFVLFAFLVVEFVGNSITAWAGPLAAALYLLALVTLAIVVWRSPIAEWTTVGAEAGSPRSVGTAAQ